jgi:hypothetical protein
VVISDNLMLVWLSQKPDRCTIAPGLPGDSTGTWDLLPPATANLGLFEEVAFLPAAIDPPINPQRSDEAVHFG